MLNWRKLIEEINTVQPSVLLAISGGVDSMCLLEFFRRKHKGQVYVAHFQHHIRDNDHRDKELVVDYCQQHDLQCLVGTGKNLASSANQEMEARLQRWAFFYEIAGQFGIRHVATAHHLNDNCENILIRLIRGDPHTCLGMRKFIEIDGIVRYKPFLEIPKTILIDYAQRSFVPWVEDETNVNNTYDRNWVRNILMPQLLERRNVLKTLPMGLPKEV